MLENKQAEILALTITESVVFKDNSDLAVMGVLKDKEGFFRWRLMHIVFTSNKFVLLAELRTTIIKYAHLIYFRDLKNGKILTNRQIDKLQLHRIITNNQKIIT